MTLLSDYGLGDAFAGVCHGVIATICPQARIIDVTPGRISSAIADGAIPIVAGFA